MINIYGAGVSGLTVAHVLAKKGFKVRIYEKNNIAGGMTRSVRSDNNVPTEHSWRGYGPFYYNLFNITKEIPIKIVENFSSYTLTEIAKHNSDNDFWCYYRGKVYNLTNYVNSHPGGSVILKAAGQNLENVWSSSGVGWHKTNSNVMSVLKKNLIGTVNNSTSSFTNTHNIRTVHDNLVKKRLLFKLLYNSKNKKNHGIKLSDYPYIIYLFLKVWLSNKRRDEYFNTRLESLLKDKISPQSYHFLVDFLAGPGYGFDKNTMSLGHYGTFLEFNYFNSESLWQVMNQPTNEAWIDPWVNYLKSLGVEFNFNSKLIEINHKNKQVNYCLVLVNGKLIKVYGKEHILCLDPENSMKITKKSNITSLYKKLRKVNVVNNQISFRLGLRKKIRFEKDNMGFVLVDSPYNITFYPQEDHWDNKVKLGMNGKIKSLWSGTIILSYKNGSLYGKSATSLTVNQLKKEIIHQFLESKQLIENIKKYNNGYVLSEKDIIFSEIFEDWYFENNRLKTKNKKWVNTFYNEKYRPTNKIGFKNLYLAGSHTKTSINIWSMEGSVESGILAANIILSKNNKMKYPIYRHKSLPIFEPLKSIDDIMYQLNLPSIVDVVIIFTIIYLINMILKKNKN